MILRVEYVIIIGDDWRKCMNIGNKRLKKEALVMLCVVLCAIVIALFMLVFTNGKKDLYIKFNDNNTLEYGNVEYNFREMVDKTNAPNLDVHNIDYYKTGDQEVLFVIQKGKDVKEFKHVIHIVDTHLPVITLHQENVHIPVGIPYDIKTNIKSIQDIADGDIPYIDEAEEGSVARYEIEGDIDIYTTGDYPIRVVAYDKNGQMVESQFVITVEEEGTTTIEPTYIDGILLVNKNHPVDATFGGDIDPDAYNALLELQAAASLEGFDIPLISGYRSYEYQAQLYSDYVAIDGQEMADRYSARPGYSEHQTGLAFDVGAVDDLYGETEAGKWLAAHAHEYGFILRYMQGKEEITGYMYEPWHIRYLGKDIALRVYQSGKTLEEYLGVN